MLTSQLDLLVNISGYDFHLILRRMLLNAVVFDPRRLWHVFCTGLSFTVTFYDVVVHLYGLLDRVGWGRGVGYGSLCACGGSDVVKRYRLLLLHCCFL